MKKEFLKFKIYKMGPKLGLSFPKSLIKELKMNIGDHIKLNIRVNGKECSFLSKLDRLVTLRKKVINELSLIKNQIIEIKSEKPTFSDRPNLLFYKNKIDLLYLIPKETRLGFDILVNEFDKDGESWLKVWYCFNRGSCKELELKRFLNIRQFGQFLGLMQSEGTKKTIDVVEFCNKSVHEHVDFLTYLKGFGINKKEIVGKFDYHPRIIEIGNIINNFERKTKIKIRYRVSGPTSGGGYGFKLIIRSRLLTEIISNSLKKIVIEISQEVCSENAILLRDAFFSKLLNGDGNIEIMSKNRKKPELRLKICDGNINYLRDYKKLMEIYGLNPHINQKYNFVRSYIDYNFAKKLLKIGAFRNNTNHKKLLFYVNLIEK